MPTYITKKQAIGIARSWMRSSKFFVVSNVTRSGPRRWCVAPRAGLHALKGSGHAMLSDPLMLKVWDNGLQPRCPITGLFCTDVPEANRWRSLNLKTLSELYRGDEHYIITDPNAPVV